MGSARVQGRLAVLAVAALLASIAMPAQAVAAAPSKAKVPAAAMVAILRDREIPGLRFYVESFTPLAPSDGKYPGQTIPGIKILVLNRSALQSVEKVRKYQLAIPNSRLVVLHSDAYHIAAANADECVTNVLSFIKETKQKG